MTYARTLSGARRKLELAAAKRRLAKRLHGTERLGTAIMMRKQQRAVPPPAMQVEDAVCTVHGARERGQSRGRKQVRYSLDACGPEEERVIMIGRQYFANVG